MPDCNHCYCGRCQVNGVEHKVCCKCGDRMAVQAPVYYPVYRTYPVYPAYPTWPYYWPDSAPYIVTCGSGSVAGPTPSGQNIT